MVSQKILGLKLKINPCSNETGTMSLARPTVFGVPSLLPAPPPPLRNGAFIFERDKIIEKMLRIADSHIHFCKLTDRFEKFPVTCQLSI